MNLQNIQEAELLSLLDKREKELNSLFLTPPWFYILPNHCCLADLAQRLWEKEVEENISQLEDTCVIVATKYFDKSDRDMDDIRAWFCWYAKPIHRIVAALIALKRAGQTEKKGRV